jgi:3-hydroxyisobutyrate dehydrogenase-like beta-hydroxyacid dehydrogenase
VNTVGVIGLGNMGMPISANLLQNGFAVLGYDVDAARAAALVTRGGHVATFVREVVARADVVITLLPSVAALDQVGGELREAGRRGLVVVEAGTFPIEDKLRARDALSAAGMILLDCTLSGTAAQAAGGDLAVYGSGDRAAYESCVPVFRGFARANYYLGEFGNGSRMKYVANLLVAIHNVAAAEAFVLGMKAGLEPDLLYKVISDGAGTSRMFEVRGPLMVKGEYEPATMAMETWQKDMKVIGEFAAKLRCPTPLFTASALLYTAGMAQGRSRQDTASVCAVLEEWARVDRGAAREAHGRTQP